MQDVIIKGRDNPVTFEFTFTGDFAALGLNNFNRITVDIGSESYDSSVDISQLRIASETELSLSIGDTTLLETGSYTPTIIGYSVTYDDGYVLNSPDKRKVTDIKVRG